MNNGRTSALLKEQTAELHRAAERSLDLNRRLRSRAAYADLISSFYRIYLPLEKHISRMDLAGVGLNWSERRKTPYLAADLVALDRDPAEVAPATNVPTLCGVGDALGCLYVMEGATLGGQVIRREVAARLGLPAERGCKFFASYGDRVGEMWGQFRSAVDGYATSPDRQATILEAARATFELFGTVLAEERR